MLTACRHGSACGCLVEDQDLNGPLAGSDTFSNPALPAAIPIVGKRQPVAVAGKASPNVMLATNPPERRVQLTRVAAHDRRSAMGEDGTPNINLFTPIKLTGDWRMADYGLSPAADHRSFHRRTIADVDVDAAKCVCRIGNPGDIGHIEEASAAC